MKRPWRTAIIGILCSTALVACSTAKSESPNEGEEDLPASLRSDAENAIEAASTPLTFDPPGPSLDLALIEGSTIDVVAIDLNVPALAAINAELQTVGKEKGVTIKTFDAKSQVNQLQLGIQQAIDSKADAIIGLGLVPALVQQQVNAAKAAGIPVLNVYSNQPDADSEGQGAGEGFYAAVAPDYAESAKTLAYKALLDAGPNASVLIITSSELQPVAGAIEDGYKAVLDQCDECKYTVKDVPLEKWGTDIAPLVVSTIRSDPDIDYVLPIFDEMGVLATAGVQQAGALGQVHVASINASPAPLDLVEEGDIFSADMGASNAWAAWAALDQAFRGILKMDPANPAVPSRYFDTDVLHDAGGTEEAQIFTQDFRDGYTKLWEG